MPQRAKDPPLPPPAPKTAEEPERSHNRFLNHILGCMIVAGQPTGEAIRRIEMRQNHRLEAGASGSILHQFPHRPHTCTTACPPSLFPPPLFPPTPNPPSRLPVFPLTVPPPS